jgi:2,4-dienoyl-CoA reductase-like NADH-dependent reductase (Old Yellow Enzyme family)
MSEAGDMASTTNNEVDGAEASVSRLFSPITLRSVTAKNRVMVSPMCQYHSVDGSPGDWQLMHLGRLAVGGAGIIFGEETAVEARGRKTYACAGIWDDRHILEYRRLTDFIKAQDAVPAMQLGHAGRKASCHTAVEDWRALTDADAADGFAPWQGLAPSAVNEPPRRFESHAMDADDIKAVLKAFHEATRRTLDAGYEILEIHGAHGYLLHQFLSPVSNLRNDGYGGDREGRMRFALEVTEVVRAAWPESLPLFFRVSSVDGEGGAWGIDDTVALAHELKARGVDVVDCSSGGIYGSSDMPVVPRIPEFQCTFSSSVRAQAGVATVAVGGITKPEVAEAILCAGDADIVALAREFLWHADWPVHAAKALGERDAYAQVPHEYGFRLRQRERQREMPINQGGDVTREAFKAIFGHTSMPSYE